VMTMNTRGLPASGTCNVVLPGRASAVRNGPVTGGAASILG
jgi:hypothetical protein